MPADSSWRRLLSMQDLIIGLIAPVSLFFVVRYALNRMDLGGLTDKEAAQRKSTVAAIMDRLDRRKRERGEIEEYEDKPKLVLNQYEEMVATEVVAPEDIRVTFDDIGGLDDTIEELKESVIYPLTLPHLYAHSSSLLSAPSGVLLYGPPGCGKTMLAKALAHESGATFINLHISTLTEKWYGDSNKIVNAVFSLARKLQPAIVFIDEIDAVLGTRRSGEHEASGMVKAEFMTHWDGLMSSNASGEKQRILILGATNRIRDIDEAILRRLPKKFSVSLPGASQRLRILGLVLKDTKVDKEHFDLEYIVRIMNGMSGSDIKEACRDAAMVPVREFMRQKRAAGARMDTITSHDIRGLRTEDFFAGVVGQGKESHPTKMEKHVRSIGKDSDSDSTEEVSSDEVESLG